MLFPPASEVCEGYIFKGVCLPTGGSRSLSRSVSVQGVSVQRGLCPEGVSVPRGLCSGGLFTGGSLSGEGGNEWAVRILLECILVLYIEMQLPGQQEWRTTQRETKVRKLLTH